MIFYRQGVEKVMPRRKKIKLRYAIGLLVIMSVVCTSSVSWYSATDAIRNSLTESYLDNNYNYANKLALSTSDLLIHMQEHINAIALTVGQKSELYSQVDLESSRITNSSYFNSLFITDTNGVIQLMSPAIIRSKDGLDIKAKMKDVSEAVQRALIEKKPLISEPYYGLAGKRILLISSPIYDDVGHYQGLVGGTIYLESNNVIENTLNKHQYENGSYVYVVDQKGRIIFHPDAERINEYVIKNEAVQKVIEGNNGAAKIMNTKGGEFFAGYAYEEKSGWGIVAQTPTSVINEPVHNLLKNMIIQDSPLLLLILFLAMLLANNLTRPINKLTKFSEDALNDHKLNPSKNLDINSRIYEVHYLYHHIKNYLDLLNRLIQIDGLTGLSNRKAFDSVMKEWVEYKTPFSLILLDIDRFKKVNDTYGHLVGDDVLKYLAKMIQSISRKEDYCFRYGGEEFVILIKDNNIDAAVEVAERLRIKVAETNSPTGEPITISLGITMLHHKDQHPEEIIERADTALYQSKSDGRNRTTVFVENSKILV